MSGPTTFIKNPETGEEKSFTFDFSYWSHASGPTFASQEIVFNDLGRDVLENSWQGYNTSLFAYGQTGSGKSYSMVGWGKDRGIIPRAMEELFRRIESVSAASRTFKVQASMLEIYNERIRDLFNPRNNPPSGLRVRENPKTGPYVEDLSQNLVKNYQEIERLMEEGSKARTIGSTNMNATSSRAHTIFQIIFTQTTVVRETGSATDRTSKINLVDLAGSERAEDTGATGDRLKEACSINKSLSALGNCISALAESACGKKKTFVPFRDSVLTWLLKESLGGNARTIMIAALSPADINFDESLSTLRYADRAKQIRNKAIVNEDANQKLIQELRSEIDLLRAQLSGGSTIIKEVIIREKDPEQEKELETLKEQLAESEKLIQNLSMTYEDQMKKTELVSKQRQEALKDAGLIQEEEESLENLRRKLPHFVNLNEDPQMNECLLYVFKPGITRIGRKDAEVVQDIPLAGINIAKQHCIVENKNNCVSLQPLDGRRSFVNGQPLVDTVILKHGNRVILGNNHIFRFVDPEEAARNADKRRASVFAGGVGEPPPEVIDWEYAQRELATAEGQLETLNSQNEEEVEMERKAKEDLEKKMKEMEEIKIRMAREKDDATQQLQKQATDYKKKEEELQKARQFRERLLKDQLAKEGKLAEMSQKMAELQKQMTRDQQAVELKFQKDKEDLVRKQKEMEARQRELEKEIEEQRLQKQVLEEKQQRKRREQEVLEQRLLKMLPAVMEANTMAEEMARPLRFHLKLVAKLCPVAKAEQQAAQTATEVCVAASNVNTSVVSMWDCDKFMNRMYIMREKYAQFAELGPAYQDDPETDPFYDPVDQQIIGTAYLYLESLVYFIEIDESMPIMDYAGKQVGELRADITFVDSRGDHNAPEDASSLVDLIGRRADFKLRISSAVGLPHRFSKSVQARYKFFYEKDWQYTEVCNQITVNPKFKYERIIVIQTASQDLIEYLQTGVLAFEVWGQLHENAPDVEAMLRPASARNQKKSVYENVVKSLVQEKAQKDQEVEDKDRKLQEAQRLLEEQAEKMLQTTVMLEAERRQKEAFLEEKRQTLDKMQTLHKKMQDMEKQLSKEKQSVADLEKFAEESRNTGKQAMTMVEEKLKALAQTQKQLDKQRDVYQALQAEHEHEKASKEQILRENRERAQKIQDLAKTLKDLEMQLDKEKQASTDLAKVNGGVQDAETHAKMYLLEESQKAAKLQKEKLEKAELALQQERAAKERILKEREITTAKMKELFVKMQELEKKAKSQKKEADDLQQAAILNDKSSQAASEMAEMRVNQVHQLEQQLRDQRTMYEQLEKDLHHEKQEKARLADLRKFASFRCHELEERNKELEVVTHEMQSRSEVAQSQLQKTGAKVEELMNENKKLLREVQVRTQGQAEADKTLKTAKLELEESMRRLKAKLEAEREELVGRQRQELAKMKDEMQREWASKEGEWSAERERWRREREVRAREDDERGEVIEQLKRERDTWKLERERLQQEGSKDTEAHKDRHRSGGGGSTASHVTREADKDRDKEEEAKGMGGEEHRRIVDELRAGHEGEEEKLKERLREVEKERAVMMQRHAVELDKAKETISRLEREKEAVVCKHRADVDKMRDGYERQLREERKHFAEEMETQRRRYDDLLRLKVQSQGGLDALDDPITANGQVKPHLLQRTPRGGDSEKRAAKQSGAAHAHPRPLSPPVPVSSSSHSHPSTPSVSPGPLVMLASSSPSGSPSPAATMMMTSGSTPRHTEVPAESSQGAKSISVRGQSAVPRLPISDTKQASSKSSGSGKGVSPRPSDMKPSAVLRTGMISPPVSLLNHALPHTAAATASPKSSPPIGPLNPIIGAPILPKLNLGSVHGPGLNQTPTRPSHASDERHSFSPPLSMDLESFSQSAASVSSSVDISSGTRTTQSRTPRLEHQDISIASFSSSPDLTNSAALLTTAPAAAVAAAIPAARVAGGAGNSSGASSDSARLHSHRSFRPLASPALEAGKQGATLSSTTSLKLLHPAPQPVASSPGGVALIIGRSTSDTSLTFSTRGVGVRAMEDLGAELADADNPKSKACTIM